jgi:hypothetical protein
MSSTTTYEEAGAVKKYAPYERTDLITGQKPHLVLGAACPAEERACAGEEHAC